MMCGCGCACASLSVFVRARMCVDVSACLGVWKHVHACRYVYARGSVSLR